METVLKKWSFSNTIVFKKLVISLTIVNNKPLLMIINNKEERGNRPEGHRYLSLSSFKENIKEVLAPPQLFPVCKTTTTPR